MEQYSVFRDKVSLSWSNTLSLETRFADQISNLVTLAFVLNSN